jgi:hypothetical protein
LIVRILKGRVHPGQVSAFREQARQALDDARGRNGVIYAEVGRQACSDGGEEVVFVSIWRDLEALYHWVGGVDLLTTPLLNNGSAAIFENFGVQHYEAYEPPDSQAAGLIEYDSMPRSAAALDATPADLGNLGAVR